MNGQFLYGTPHTISTPHMKTILLQRFQEMDIIRFRGL